VLMRLYTPADRDLLFQMFEDEGPDWAEYYQDSTRRKYEQALEHSITYLAFADDKLCGYVRCREDDGFGVYIYDLLVAKAFRGHAIGSRLMAQVRADFPEQTVYVMSDVDEYYEKLGYKREGSIFVVS